MRRDTLVFTAAGIVFGFVLGYMAANWGLMPQPIPLGPAGTASATPAAFAPAETTTPTAGVDPNEVRALESLAARDPRDAAARIELGNLLMDHKRWEEAIRWYREALALNPAQPNVITDLGACLVDSGHPAEGLAEFEKVLQQDPNHRNALYNKAIALMQLGKPAEAADVLENLMKRHPEDPQVQTLRAQVQTLRASSGGGR